MAISIVTLANLGEKRNLKSTDIEPVIRVFADKGILERVICQVSKHFYYPKTVNSVPVLVRYGIRLLERAHLMSRLQSDAVFDFFAARKLPASPIVLLHGGDLLPRTTARAKHKGALVINLAVMAHLKVFADLEKREAREFGLDDAPGVYARMYTLSQNTDASDYFITLSDFAKHTYIEHGIPGDRIYTAAPDIDTARFSPAALETNKKTFKVVYAAYTTSIKGLRYLLDAWKQLALPNAELVLVGGYGEMPRRVSAQYDTMISADPSITKVGNTPAPERYYQDASVLVLPSLAEGFGRVTLEAMACGLPVITTENARGIVEDGKTGFVVPIRDARALADKIKYLYEHRDVAERMGKEARKAIENKKPFGEAVYEIYQDILKREHKL